MYWEWYCAENGTAIRHVQAIHSHTYMQSFFLSRRKCATEYLFIVCALFVLSVVSRLARIDAYGWLSTPGGILPLPAPCVALLPSFLHSLNPCLSFSTTRPQLHFHLYLPTVHPLSTLPLSFHSLSRSAEHIDCRHPGWITTHTMPSSTTSSSRRREMPGSNPPKRT